MGRPEIVSWFDRNWMPAYTRARVEGWDALSRPDQVLVAVGYLMDSFLSDAVLLVVDGMHNGYDTGLTARMPDALDEVGLSQAAEHVREIIRLRAPSGSARKDAANRKKAIDHLLAIGRLFDEWVPGGERVMLTRLHEWYHARPGEKG